MDFLYESSHLLSCSFWFNNGGVYVRIGLFVCLQEAGADGAVEWHFL